jgi:hypothetical protein
MCDTNKWSEFYVNSEGSGSNTVSSTLLRHIVIFFSNFSLIPGQQAKKTYDTVSSFEGMDGWTENSRMAVKNDSE